MAIDRREFLRTGMTIAAGTVAVPPALARFLEGTVVETAQGNVRGLVATNGINVFKGMRYGGSSAGILRFRPPVAPPK